MCPEYLSLMEILFTLGDFHHYKYFNSLYIYSNKTFCIFINTVHV